jgi:hypothetical protein
MSDIKVDEIMQVLKALEIAINKRIFTKSEIDTFFPAWNNLTSIVEKIKRQNIIDQMYKESIENVE